jgi:hypothetical protein
MIEPVGEAHVEQRAGAGVGRPGVVGHPLQQRRKLEKRELISEAECAVLGPQQRGDHKGLPLRVEMLAEVAEQLGRDDLGLNAVGLFQAAAEGLGNGKRVGQRIAERLAAFLELRIKVALRLDVVADPGFGRDECARVSGRFALCGFGRTPLQLA